MLSSPGSFCITEELLALDRPWYRDGPVPRAARAARVSKRHPSPTAPWRSRPGLAVSVPRAWASGIRRRPLPDGRGTAWRCPCCVREQAASVADRSLTVAARLGDVRAARVSKRHPSPTAPW